MIKDIVTLKKKYLKYKNMHYRFLIALSMIGLVFTGCKNLPHDQATAQINQEPNVESYGIQGILWQQNSGEYEALCYQAFNVAQLYLEKELAQKSASGKPLAIITDIDETVLDNSPYQATQADKGESYSQETWAAWGDQEAAMAVPGALAFLKYAEKNHVEVFYISDRYESQNESTLQNLKNVNFPYADAEHLLLKRKGVDKEARREKVLKNYDVVIYMGDNLSDFSAIYDDQSTKKRNALTKQEKADFGTKFIVLPNPMYGAWMNEGIYEGKYDWTPTQKDSIIRTNLKKY